MESIIHIELTQNQYNVGICSRNTSGYKGVYWYKGRSGYKGCWNSRIMIKGKQISLGYFHNLEDAAKAYLEASKRYQGEFASTG